MVVIRTNFKFSFKYQSILKELLYENILLSEKIKEIVMFGNRRFNYDYNNQSANDL